MSACPGQPDYVIGQVKPHVKDFTTQEKKSTEKPEENTKSEGIPEFFLDKEKESEEKK